MARSSVLEEWVTWSFSPTKSAIAVTLLVSIIVPVLIHWYLYRKASAKELPTILLVGPSGGGKTSLLTLLANTTPSPTHTSQAPQSALCRLPASTRALTDKYRSENDTSRSHPQFRLLDTPGHGKLRHHAFASLTSPNNLRGLIYVIDSAAISSVAGLTAAAEYLHDILLLLQKRHTQSKTSKDPHAIPVLLAANKQDVFTSLPTALVGKKLEEEIGRVRQTRSRGLMDSGVGMEDGGAEDEEMNWLGEYGAKVFKFEQMEEHGIEVGVLGGNVKGEEEGKVEEWWAWIGEQL